MLGVLGASLLAVYDVEWVYSAGDSDGAKPSVGNAVTTDSDGNIYFTGAFGGTVQFCQFNNWAGHLNIYPR